MSSFDLLFSEKTILRSHTDPDCLHTLSQWSQSSTKRWFDVACILCALPLWFVESAVNEIIAKRMVKKGSRQKTDNRAR